MGKKRENIETILCLLLDKLSAWWETRAEGIRWIFKNPNEGEDEVSSELSRWWHKATVIWTESKVPSERDSAGCFSAGKYEFPELLTALEYPSPSQNSTAQALRFLS